MAVTRRNAAVPSSFDHVHMLLHQGIGLDALDEMPMRRAVHTLFECCFSVPLAADLARARPFESHDSLFRCADRLIFELSDESVDAILQAYSGYSAEDLLAAMSDRPLNDYETERKVVRNELARISRARLEQMLGPEGGYNNW